MNLHVSKDGADVGFIEALIDRIKRYLYISTEKHKDRISLCQEYINSNIKMFSYSLDFINIYDVIDSGIQNLIYKESQKDFIIEIDKKKFIYGVYVSVAEMCAFINYGNLTVGGLYLFSEEFIQIEKDLKKLQELYYSGELI